MANFDATKQKMVPLSGVRMEQGAGVSIASVSGQTFTVACKLKKVLGGIGVMETDGMIAKPSAGAVSGGQATFTRYAPIVTDADTINYTLWGY